jgi:hypothetical protein
MGRRWGKTYMAGTMALSVADHGGSVAWVVPTYKNARPTWRFVESMTAGLAEVKVNKTDKTVDFPNGGWLGVYSADNDVGLRGEAFDVVIVDEAAQVAETTYLDVILPTLADRDGRCLLISTPKGKNWFWREWVNALSDGKYAAAFQAPTSANPMPTIRKAFDLAREKLPERTYRQEWLAQFIEDGGEVFRAVTDCAIANRLAARAHGRQYVIGVDWGRVNDATVFSVVDVAGKAQVHLERMTQIDYGMQVARLKSLCERFRPTVILAELNSMGGPLVEQLAREGLPVRGFTTTNATKAEIIEGLSLALERHEIKILNDAVQIAELQAYESERLPSGLVRYGAPEGSHDDTVIALALSWHAAAAGRGTRATSREY